MNCPSFVLLFSVTLPTASLTMTPLENAAVCWQPPQIFCLSRCKGVQCLLASSPGLPPTWTSDCDPQFEAWAQGGYNLIIGAMGDTDCLAPMLREARVRVRLGIHLLMLGVWVLRTFSPPGHRTTMKGNGPLLGACFFPRGKIKNAGSKHWGISSIPRCQTTTPHLRPPAGHRLQIGGCYDPRYDPPGHRLRNPVVQQR